MAIDLEAGTEDALELGALADRLALGMGAVIQKHLRPLRLRNQQLQAELIRQKGVLQERWAETERRPAEHNHDPDDPQPCLVFDLDGTLKPDRTKTTGGNYPIVDRAFPGVAKVLSRFKSRGCCLHMTTAGLYYGSKQDDEVATARKQMIQAWLRQEAIPIDLLLPKVPSDLYYDDRMIEIPSILNGGMVDDKTWPRLGEQAEEAMAKRFDLKGGIWVRKDKKRVGDLIDDWPTPEEYSQMKDRPRGFSGPRLDIDMHRTASEASSSMRTAPPRPGAVECITDLYNSGVTIRMSCAGWNPATHDPEETRRRLAGIRMWLLQYGIPYDRVVAKDHADLYFDDKGVQFHSWAQDLPELKRRLPMYETYRHGD